MLEVYMAKKPKVFENEINKNIHNNKEVFDSAKEEFEIREEKEEVHDGQDNSSVVDKITRLLNRNGYIFNVDVLIITRDGQFKTHIASVVNNHIITLDNDVINIDDVVDIRY